MKILVVCRYHGTHVAAFITEQADALRALGNEVQFVMAEQGGLKGYLRLLHDIRRTISEWHPDVIHAHFGICGLVANLQRKVPVVVTYPGSDVNSAKTRPISILSMRLSAYNLLMSKRQLEKVKGRVDESKIAIQCYGINLDAFPHTDKAEARKAMELDADKKYVLFSSKFVRRPEKDPQLAMAAIARLNELLHSMSREHRSLNDKKDVELLPLTGGYTKEEMATLMSAVDAALVTSKTEGSPQFTKEVMACGCPIVSVDVGDVAEQVEGLDGCYISKTREPEELAELLKKAMAFGKTKGYQHIINKHFDNQYIAQSLNAIYEEITTK